MLLPSSLMRYNGNTSGYYSGIIFSNRQAIAAATPSNQYNFAAAIDSVVPWTWIWLGAGHAASNTRVGIRRLNCYLLLDAVGNGTWYRYIADNCPEGFINNIPFSNNDYGNQRLESDGITRSCKPGADAAYELWPVPFHFVNKPLVQRVRGIYCEVELALILDNPAGTDDRHLARFTAQQGFDIYSWANQSSGFTGRPQDSGNPYPKHAVEGGGARYKQITTTPQIFSVAPLNGYYTQGYPPPWGSYTGNWPYQHPPWTMTPDEFSNNHPSHLT